MGDGPCVCGQQHPQRSDHYRPNFMATPETWRPACRSSSGAQGTRAKPRPLSIMANQPEVKVRHWRRVPATAALGRRVGSLLSADSFAPRVSELATPHGEEVGLRDDVHLQQFR
jgi:hypothetical protein